MRSILIIENRTLKKLYQSDPGQKLPDGAEKFTILPDATVVKIPDGVTKIGFRCFEFHKTLTTIILPKSLTSIEAGAFLFCTHLASIILPVGVTSIGKGAFRNCSSLTSITLPVGVTSILEGTFFGCERLTSVTALSVNKLGEHAFAGCNILSEMQFSESGLGFFKNSFVRCFHVDLDSSTSDEDSSSLEDDGEKSPGVDRLELPLLLRSSFFSPPKGSTKHGEAVVAEPSRPASPPTAPLGGGATRKVPKRSRVVDPEDSDSPKRSRVVDPEDSDSPAGQIHVVIKTVCM